MGIGDWGLGIGDWGLGPIPNPHHAIIIFNILFEKILIFAIYIYIYIIYFFNG